MSAKKNSDHEWKRGPDRYTCKRCRVWSPGSRDINTGVRSPPAPQGCVGRPPKWKRRVVLEAFATKIEYGQRGQFVTYRYLVPPFTQYSTPSTTEDVRISDLGKKPQNQEEADAFVRKKFRIVIEEEVE